MKRAAAYFALLAVSNLCFSQQYKVIHAFNFLAGDGSAPYAGLIADKAGNLYGTTSSGGTGVGQGGTVFELSPDGSSGWSETILYNFCQSGYPCVDGNYLEDTLTMDAAGNLYGTTEAGGTGGAPGGGGAGVVFELSPPMQQVGAWTETVLYNFCSDYINSVCLDGAFPYSNVIFDTLGNIYGTTSAGGAENGGIVFELSPGSAGYTENVIHTFCSNYRNGLCLDGFYPDGGLTFDKSGNFWGTTSEGGTSPQGDGSGMIFKLSPGTKGWAETTVYNFGLPQPTTPLTAVTLDSAGNIYGTLARNGVHKNSGGLFQWTRSNGLREIEFKGVDGASPNGTILIDSSGRGFFGTTTLGGKDGLDNDLGAGVVYHVSPAGKKTTIYEFCSQANCTDGQNPTGNLVEDAQGNLYGTASQGGTYGAGVVFEITP